MTIEYKPVDGLTFAAEASRLLQLAWTPPALFYSPAYVAWQLGFPGPCPAPAAAAFSGSHAVGFAATMHRRLQVETAIHDVFVLSFVAVDPAFRGQGIAHQLYLHLLEEIQQTKRSIVTFGRANTAGLRAIERAYPAAGMTLHPFGSYSPFATLSRPTPAAHQWKETFSPPAWTPHSSPQALNTPTPAQWEHYFRDPRPRRLLVHRDHNAWAWSTELQFLSLKGLETVTSLESITFDDPAVLPSLAAAAGESILVQASNLSGVPPEQLRPLGFRQTSTPWMGYWAAPQPPPAPTTNLEIC